MRTVSFLFLLFCIGSVSIASAQNFRKSQPKRELPKASVKQKKLRKDICHLPASVSGLNLSHTEVAYACPPSSTACSASPRIEVAAVGPMLDSDYFVYAVSGGKIVGSGANVQWDLSGVQPGEYTITSGIYMSGFGVVGQTQTRRVRVL